MNRVKYNPLIPEKIFIGSERDAQDMVDIAGCECILDLREKASKPAFSDKDAQWLHIGLNDHSTGQEQLLKQAINTAITAYHEGKKVGIHCESGICRTSAVAIGVLIELGICKKLKEASEFITIIRKQTAIHPHLKQTLQNLYR